MNIRTAAIVAASTTVAATGIGLGVLAGRTGNADLYNPIAMTALGGNPVGLMANGSFLLGGGALMGLGALEMRLGGMQSTSAAVAVLGAALCAGPVAGIVAELTDGD